MIIDFAPLQGYTDAAYRRFHREIYGESVMHYYSPFIRVEKGIVREKDIRDILPENNSGVTLIPQIIVGNVDEFERTVQAITSLGYRHIDINMGCPFPLQVKRGRGAGLLPRIDVVKDILCEVRRRADVSFSVKLRLGVDDPEQCFDIVDIINDTPLRCVTMHPRLAVQQYKGEVDYAKFREFCRVVKHPVIYNGDITSIDDIKRITEEFPGISGIMIGRGMLARPSLAAEYLAGKEMELSEQKTMLLALHNRLYEHYSNVLQGESHLLMKMKTFWEYLEPTIGHKCHKAIRKASSIAKYQIAVSAIQ